MHFLDGHVEFMRYQSEGGKTPVTRPVANVLGIFLPLMNESGPGGDICFGDLLDSYVCLFNES